MNHRIGKTLGRFAGDEKQHWFDSNIVWNRGKGDKIKFWGDKWLGDITNGRKFGTIQGKDRRSMAMETTIDKGEV